MGNKATFLEEDFLVDNFGQKKDGQNLMRLDRVNSFGRLINFKIKTSLETYGK